MDLGPHAVFILGSYAAVIALVGGLIVWLMLEGHSRKQELADLEARGIKRRSSDD